MAVKNPPWQRDELILALDLYFRFSPRSISQSHPEVVRLSDLLNELPIHDRHDEYERFRNPNGVYMKMCNFLRLDPEYTGSGLQRGGKLEEVIWNEFARDRENLAHLAETIRSNYQSAAVQEPDSGGDSDEHEFPEGKVLFRLHRSRERSAKLVREAKARAINRAGTLECEACGFNFEETYGSIGHGFIECHHKLPLSDLDAVTATRLSDLALVCSNCHRMLHRRRPWMAIDDLRNLLRQGFSA